MNRYEQPRTQMRALAGARLALAASVMALLAALVFAAGQQRASAASPAIASKKQQTALLPEGERPNFVVIQTDDQTLDQLYATYTPPGGAPIAAMPNTLAQIAEKGMTFNRYYVSYPLCCPSRVSLMTGRYAHNNNVRGNVPPNGGYTGFSFRQADSHNIATWLQGAGYRTIHIGKFLNGYGDEPFDDGRTVPPGWSAWHTTLKADTNHYFYGYTLNDNGILDGPFGDSGSWDTREYGPRDDFGCPFAPLNGQPCLYETDVFTRIASEEMLGTPETQPFYLQLDYTAPHGDFRRPAGPEPATRALRLLRRRALPARPRRRLQRGQRQRQAALHPRSRLPLAERDPHLPRLLPEGAGVAAGDRRRRPAGRQHARRHAPAAQHLHRLHLRQRLLLRRAPVDRRQVPRLRALDPSALPDPRAGDQTRQLDRRAGGQHRHRPDDPRTGPRRSRQKHRRTFAGSLPARPRTAHQAADPLRVLRRDQRRRRERRRPSRGAGRGGCRRHRRRRQRQRPPQRSASASIVAPPKDYEGIRLGPYKYIEWPDGEKELYDINKDPFELNNKARNANFFPIRASSTRNWNASRTASAAPARNRPKSYR